MAEVGGQLGELPLDVEPISVPVDQGPYSESMPHIVKPGAAPDTPALVRRRSEPDLKRDRDEGGVHRTSRDAGAALGDKEAGRQGRGHDLVPFAAISYKRMKGGRMYGHESSLAELRPSDGEYPSFEIDIVAVEAQGFTDAHPGHREQTEERGVGAGSEPPWGKQVRRP